MRLWIVAVAYVLLAGLQGVAAAGKRQEETSVHRHRKAKKQKSQKQRGKRNKRNSKDGGGWPWWSWRDRNRGGSNIFNWKRKYKRKYRNNNPPTSSPTNPATSPPTLSPSSSPPTSSPTNPPTNLPTGSPSLSPLAFTSSFLVSDGVSTLDSTGFVDQGDGTIALTGDMQLSFPGGASEIFAFTFQNVENVELEEAGTTTRREERQMATATTNQDGEYTPVKGKDFAANALKNVNFPILNRILLGPEGSFGFGYNTAENIPWLSPIVDEQSQTSVWWYLVFDVKKISLRDSTRGQTTVTPQPTASPIVGTKSPTSTQDRLGGEFDNLPTSSPVSRRKLRSSQGGGKSYVKHHHNKAEWWTFQDDSNNSDLPPMFTPSEWTSITEELFFQLDGNETESDFRLSKSSTNEEIIVQRRLAGDVVWQEFMWSLPLVNFAISPERRAVYILINGLLPNLYETIIPVAVGSYVFPVKFTIGSSGQALGLSYSDAFEIQPVIRNELSNFEEKVILPEKITADAFLAASFSFTVTELPTQAFQIGLAATGLTVWVDVDVDMMLNLSPFDYTTFPVKTFALEGQLDVLFSIAPPIFKTPYVGGLLNFLPLLYGTCTLGDAFAYVSNTEESFELAVAGRLGVQSDKCKFGTIFKMFKFPFSFGVLLYAHYSTKTGAYLRGETETTLNILGKEFNIGRLYFDYDSELVQFNAFGRMDIPGFGNFEISGTAGMELVALRGALRTRKKNPFTQSTFEMQATAEIGYNVSESEGYLEIDGLLEYCPFGSSSCFTGYASLEASTDGVVIICSTILDGVAEKLSGGVIEDGCMEWNLYDFFDGDREDGEDCTLGIQCKSGRCENQPNGKCFARQENGQGCNEDNDCISASYCDRLIPIPGFQGTCEPKRADGEGCSTDAQCQSNDCRRSCFFCVRWKCQPAR